MTRWSLSTAARKCLGRKRQTRGERGCSVLLKIIIIIIYIYIKEVELTAIKLKLLL